MKAISKRAKIGRLLIHIFLMIGCVITLYPLIWMLVSSFKSTTNVMSVPPVFFPKNPTFENYATVFGDYIGRFFLNSLWIAVVKTAIPVYTSALLGYIFAKFRFKGKNAMFYVFIATMMVPWIVTIIPLYNLFNKMHLLDSYWALILPAVISGYGVYLVRSFMYQVPTELIESARIDGCSEFAIFNRIIMPLVKPAMAALGIILFLGAWDDYLWPFLVLTTESKYTLTIGLAKYAFKQYTIAYGPVLAGSVISILPVVIVYIFLQKHIVEGISLGGVKG